MRSMTGFGSSEFTSEKIRITVDLKAYNNKYLDISLNMSNWLGVLEGRIRDFIKSKGILRGRIDLNIRVKELQENLKVTIDKSVVSEVKESLKQVEELSGCNTGFTLSDLLSFEGVVKTEKERDLEAVWNELEPLINSVLDQFLVDKTHEGEALRRDIFSSLDIIDSCVTKVEDYIPAIERKIKGNFLEKFREVLGEEVDENRILSELGVLLVKYDINEEVVRLRSHIKNFKKSSDIIPCGKKLDFICQEMNREINTIGSKSPIIEISEIVVDMKNSLEQIREQARNVE